MTMVQTFCGLVFRSKFSGVSISYVLLIAACLFVQDVAAGSAKPSVLDARFQDALDEMREEAGFPGATAAYMLADGTVRGFATGSADVENNVEMSADTKMLSASIGKMYVAAVVVDLAEAGLLNLDDNVSQWLGTYDWYSRLPNGEDITVKMLLNHSSGISDHVHDPEFLTDARARIFEGDADYVFSPEQLVSYVLDKSPLFPAGTSFSYSDTGYILLGLVIEQATGGSYYQELNNRVLGPLKLNATIAANRRDLPMLAQGYRPSNDKFGNLPTTMTGAFLNTHPSNEWTGGGLATTSADLVRWVFALLHDNAIAENYRSRVLDAAIALPSPRDGVYGLGVATASTDFGEKYGHGGWYPGYTSSLGYYADHQIAVAIMVNTDREGQNDVIDYTNRLAGVVVEAVR